MATESNKCTHISKNNQEINLPYNSVEILLRHAAILPSSIPTNLTLARSLLRWHRHCHASIGVPVSSRSGS